MHRRRKDLSEYLKKLKVRTLIIVGENSPFHRDALQMSVEMDRRYNALIEVRVLSVCLLNISQNLRNEALELRDVSGSSGSSSADSHMNVQVQACGSLVTEEQPHSMLIPIEYFLMGYAFYRPIQLTHSAPTSPLSPPCVSPELLSPESLGIKLKPIKTRVSNPE